MTGAFAFDPELLARAAEEGDIAGFERLGECGFVHEAEHENAPGFVFLNDGRDEPVELAEIKFHLYARNKKARRFERRASFRWFTKVEIQESTRRMEYAR